MSGGCHCRLVRQCSHTGGQATRGTQREHVSPAENSVTRLAWNKTMTSDASADAKNQVDRTRRRILTACLLIVPLLVGFGVYRIRQNRIQRDAMAELWSMGALTASRDDAVFTAPMSGVDWVMKYGRTGWLDDLEGFPKPVAAFFSEAESPEFSISDDDVGQLAEVLHRLPSVKAVFLGGTRLTEDGMRRLQREVPSCQFSRQEKSRMP
jgi:hypothetical protein